AKAKAQDLYDQVCFMLSIKEAQLFGLTILRENGEYEFLDLKTKLSKYAPKGWKSDSSENHLTVYLKVQLYVEHVSLLKDDVTRHHYYLQLKQNVLQAPVQCREEACFVLASYALQADLGNYSEEEHSGRYFEPADYFPEWVIKRRGETYIIKHMPSMHRDQRGTTPAYAQKAFIREASTTAEHQMHFYRLKKYPLHEFNQQITMGIRVEYVHGGASVFDSEGKNGYQWLCDEDVLYEDEQTPSIWLGICTKGVHLYEDCSDGKYLLCEYAWGVIKRLIFQKKKFELLVEGVSDGRKITYYTCTEAKSKHLLRLCKVTHTFQMQTQPQVERARKRESASEKKRYRESYISGDISWSDLDSSMTTTSYSEMSATKVEQRLSVISNVSSVATSGIVSDERPPMEKTLTENDDLSSTSKALESSTSGMLCSPGVQLEPQLSVLPSLSREDILQADCASNRHSAAMSDASSHREHHATHSSSSSELGRMPAHQLHSEIIAVPSESEWASDDEAEDEDDDEDEQRYHRKLSSSSNPHLIDTRKIRAEIADKDVTAPLLSALCNDPSLLIMQQQQQKEQLSNANQEDHSLDSNDLSRTSSSRGSGSVHEKSYHEDLNNSLTTLVSHSSIDSDMHSSVVDRLNANSCSMLNAPSVYSIGLSHGQLSKHQTLSTLNDLGDVVDNAPFDARLSFDAASDGRVKCQTLPSKMNASEQMLLLGASVSTVSREESVSYSAPNLSPGAKVPIASH
ncbi:uncharacterized protein, partial [Diadema antillarum]|uniref:uncharacterized protein n=1 Tax=Diadema antillarum TaxID=105358 RepID=UPI003A8A9949